MICLTSTINTLPAHNCSRYNSEREREKERGTNWIRILREHKTMTYCKDPDETRQLDLISFLYLSFWKTDGETYGWHFTRWTLCHLWFFLMNHKYFKELLCQLSFALIKHLLKKMFFFFKQNAADHEYLILRNVVGCHFPKLFKFRTGNLYMLLRRLCSSAY